MINTTKDDACKPIVLSVTGIGVPEFIEPKVVKNDDDADNVIKRNKSQLYDRPDVVPTSRNGRGYLLKEVLRRVILNCIPTQPRLKNWTTAKTIIWLKKNGPPVEEHAVICQTFDRLKTVMREFYLHGKN